MILPSNTKVCLFASGCVLTGVVVGGGLMWWMKSRKKDEGSFNAACFWPHCIKSEELNRNKIHIVTKADDTEQLIPLLKEDLTKIKLLGFDCEWSSTKRGNQPVSLIQMATISGRCLLIRIGQMKEKLPLYIINLLQDKDVLKVGVGIHDDARKLLLDYGLVVSGCVDLRSLSARNRQVVPQSLSLKGLALTYLTIVMEKSKRIQCSDWDAEVLSEKQIWYAANDAYIAVRIFSKMIVEKLNTNSDLESVVHSAITGALWSQACSYCQGLKDVKYKEKSRKKNAVQTKGESTNIVQCNKPFKSYSTRKLPLYDNCKLEAPDGQLLSTCDKKKADWYISRELGDLVSENPFVVRLRFEPAGRPNSNRDYYLYDKDNVCVVCGDSGSIVRKNVVPHEYRKHFPLVLKDHVSHDIVPLCVTCHQRAGYYDHILRQSIGEEYQAPLGSIQAVQLLEDPERRSVRSAGRALAKAGDRIPQPRRSELEGIILKFFESETISNDLIAEASELETRYKNESFIPHGEKVVSTVLSTDKLPGLVNFERRWREHFLSTMQPKHLPRLWSVEHNHDRLAERDLLET